MTSNIRFTDYPDVTTIQSLTVRYRASRAVQKSSTIIREDGVVSGMTTTETPPSAATLAAIRAEVRHVADRMQRRRLAANEWIAGTVALVEFAEEAAGDDPSMARDARLLRQQLRKANIEIAEFAR
jgi:hypothetical protein